MKRKKLITALAITAALTIPVSVYAATSDSTTAKKVRGFLGIDTSKLTDTQKADITTYKQKMAELQKEFINKMVANGTITKEQGDAQIAKIDEQLKNSDSTSIPGFGGGKEDREGRGMKGGFEMYGIDVSKLTDAQKADLTAEIKKIADLQKELITKAVSSSLLTKEQGDSYTKSIDEALADMQKNGISEGTKLLGGFKCFNIMKGIDTSKLTDAQKAIFTDYNTRLTALQKELVNKMVADGALTKDQGTAAITRIDEMSKMQSETGTQMGCGRMGKGDFKGRGRMFDGNGQNNSSSGNNSGTTSGTTSGITTGKSS